MTAWLRPVAAALDARAAAPARPTDATPTAPARLFFRDDDVGWGDARLFALLDLFARHELPLDLAVIPDELDAGLARELYGRPVGLHQHGFAHVNHELEGRKCEFGPARDLVDQVRDLVAGQKRMRAMLGRRVDPIFTPPWNRCTADTGRALTSLGFRVLSREARAEPLGEEGLLELPVSVDFVRLDPALAATRIAEGITAGGPVGVMFHHEVMNDDLLHRTNELLELIATHPAAHPSRMRDLARTP